MIYIAAFLYVAVMLLANLLVSRFGPAISPVLAFFLIGFDLTMRDWLQVRLRAWQMGALIAASGGLTYLLNPAAGQIAVASACAFTVAALADWLTFTKLRGTWLFRANGSNVVGAAVDSLVFPTLAWGALMPGIVLAQFAAKVIGGALWAWVLSRSSPVSASPTA
jgi:queuosine precursor transporter